MFVPKHLNFKISEAKKKTGICCAYSCKNNGVDRKRNLCHKHYHIYRRILDPVYDRYVNFKRNAGYHIWNIQLLTNSQNVKKYHNHDKHFTELPEKD